MAGATSDGATPSSASQTYENGSVLPVRITRPKPGNATAAEPRIEKAAPRETGKCACALPEEAQKATTPSAMRAQRGLMRMGVVRAA
jgi:hypothetical protein